MNSETGWILDILCQRRDVENNTNTLTHSQYARRVSGSVWVHAARKTICLPTDWKEWRKSGSAHQRFFPFLFPLVLTITTPRDSNIEEKPHLIEGSFGFSSWLYQIRLFLYKAAFLCHYHPLTPPWSSIVPSYFLSFFLSFFLSPLRFASSCFESTATEGPAHAHPPAGREAEKGEGEQEEEKATEPEDQPQAETPHPSPPPPAVPSPGGVPPSPPSPERPAT